MLIRGKNPFSTVLFKAALKAWEIICKITAQFPWTPMGFLIQFL